MINRDFAEQTSTQIRTNIYRNIEKRVAEPELAETLNKIATTLPIKALYMNWVQLNKRPNDLVDDLALHLQVKATTRTGIQYPDISKATLKAICYDIIKASIDETPTNIDF